jgi:DHA2 family multidrug resistance protein
MNLCHIWILVVVVSASAIQNIVATSVNVALPHMTGELGATPDSISWVVTAYLIAPI